MAFQTSHRKIEQQNPLCLEYITKPLLNQEKRARALDQLGHYQAEKQRRRQEVFGHGSPELQRGSIDYKRSTAKELAKEDELTQGLERMHLGGARKSTQQSAMSRVK